MREPQPVETSADGLATSVAGTVLIVDDSAEVRSVFRRALEHAGYKVLCAADGEEGLRTYLAHSNDVDVVVLDFEMPVCTGDKLLQDLRARDPSLPAILCSAYEFAVLEPMFAPSGVTCYLPKPCAPSTLVAGVRTLVVSGRE